MAKRTNILSFDVAQRSATTVPFNQNANRNTQRQTVSSRDSVRTSKASSSSSAARNASSGRGASASRNASSGRSASAGRNASSGRGASASRAASQKAQQEQSHMQALKRNMAKSKADRAFTKQYGDIDSGASENAPRAALYKTQMGSKQRQAVRMQNANSSSSFSWSSKAFRKSSSITKSPRFIGCMAVVVSLVLTCVILYSPAQQYYWSVREHDQLEAEYAAVVEHNQDIENSVANLSSDEGVTAAAHDQLGWVEEGEEIGKVKGINTSDDVTSTVSSNIASGSVEAPETWYSPMLDLIFGVE